METDQFLLTGKNYDFAVSEVLDEACLGGKKLEHYWLAISLLVFCRTLTLIFRFNCSTYYMYMIMVSMPWEYSTRLSNSYSAVFNSSHHDGIIWLAPFVAPMDALTLSHLCRIESSRILKPSTFFP